MREPRSPASSALPRSFGDYELLEEIARGGMGIVYKARQKSLGRFVAVKFLLRGPLAGGDFIKRFRIEASAAAALQHPNIVAIHEVGVREGEHFLAMDYVDGPNLARLVKDHPLAPKTAAHYLKTVAEAIHYAHEKGILHRDLKPSNVLIDSNDQPRVTDFGLAKRLVTESQPPLDVTQLTLTGHVLGSAGYMSPEQATGAKGKMGRASDVYSLGAMLYHLLTGRPPFAGGSLAETLNQIQNQEPVALRLLNPTVPRDLETICLKCLEKDPAHRFPTAKLMAEELGRFLRHEPILLRPVSRPEKVWRWARRKPALAALFVLVQLVGAVGLTGILWQWNRAERLAKERGQERDRAESAVRDLQLKRVEDLLEMNRASVALARLAQILRQDPANPTASLRTVSLLSHRTFALPAAPPLRHGGRVNGASFSPDGLRVVTASNDQTAQQWIARTGEKIGPPLVHDGPVNAAAFSPNGRHLVTASDDHTAKVWEAATGALFGWALVHSNRVLSAQFSPDGASILTVGADQAAYLWDTTSGALRHVLRHQGVITSARFSVDGQRVVTASNDGTAALWDAASGQRLRRVTHGQRVMWAELSPDGSRLAAAGYDDQASLWDTATGQRLARIRHRLDVVECVAFRPDGREFATCGRDRTVRLHDGRTGNATDKQFVHDAIVFRLEYSRDGQRLLAHCLDGTLWVWETASGRLGCEPIHHLLPVNEAHFSPDGQWVVAAGNDQAAHVWDARPGAMLGVRLPHGQNVRIGFSPDGRRVATASLDGSARVWDSRTGEPVTPPMWHTHWLMEPRFDASGKWLLSCSIDGTACVWNAETGEPRFPMVRHGGRIDFAAFSPDGRLFVTTCRDGTIRLWNATNGQPASPLLHHDATPAWIYAARFSPDGRHLVTCSASGSARIWDVATGQRRGDPMLHEAQVNDARFSPDGRRIVTASFDMTARVWDGQTGQPLSPPLRHRGRLKVAMFSPDGGRLVTCGEFDTVQLWDAKNWQPLGEEMRQLGDVRELSAFSPDGAWVATGSVEGQARVWHAFTGKPLPEPLQAGSILTSMAFGAERSWLGLGFGDSFGMVIELPEAPTPAPDWLAPLAEAVAGLRLA
ncbi:MAG TPA: protein kinase, partial [Methylomirabilota bacterium]|nr:protein kinase [Methylomirabilota bacterium]